MNSNPFGFSWHIDTGLLFKDGHFMEPDQLIEQADLVKRYAESVKAGKPIEIECRERITLNAEWKKTCVPAWDLCGWDYREKPRPREVFIVAKYGLYASTNMEMALLHAAEVGGEVVRYREVAE